MRSVKNYISACPLKYKIVSFYVVPVLYMLSAIFYYIGGTGGLIAASVVPFSYSLGFEFIFDVNANGPLYRKADPFGKMILVSTNGSKYVRDFFNIDIIRRLAAYPLLSALGVILQAIIFKDFSLKLLMSFIFFGLLNGCFISLSIYIFRHIDNSMLASVSTFLFVMVGGVLFFIIPSQERGIISSLLGIILTLIISLIIYYMIGKRNNRLIKEMYFDGKNKK